MFFFNILICSLSFTVNKVFCLHKKINKNKKYVETLLFSTLILTLCLKRPVLKRRGGGGTKLFHAFRVVYTFKELESHAKHGQSLKKTIWTLNRVFLCQKSHFLVRTSLGEFFSIVALADVNDGGSPYMGISPGRTRLCTH